MNSAHPIAPGIYELDIDEYLGEQGYISSSGLKRVLESPEALQRYLLRQHDSSPRLDFGTAVHCALLEPERFEREYVALPVEHVDLFHEEDIHLIRQARKHPLRFITQRQMEALHGIREQVARLPEISSLLAEGVAERSLFWRDSATEVRCKIRPDLLVLPHLILELKTTFDASLAVFQRTMQMQRYHLSAAMYLEGVRHLTGSVPNYIYLVASRHPPYRVETFVPGPEILQEGERLFRKALLKVIAEPVWREKYR